MSSQAVHQNPALLLTDGRPDAGREKTDGFGTTGQAPDTLITWPHKPLNALYYDSSTRDVVPFTGNGSGAVDLVGNVSVMSFFVVLSVKGLALF